MGNKTQKVVENEGGWEQGFNYPMLLLFSIVVFSETKKQSVHYVSLLCRSLLENFSTP